MLERLPPPLSKFAQKLANQQASTDKEQHPIQSKPNVFQTQLQPKPQTDKYSKSVGRRIQENRLSPSHSKKDRSNQNILPSKTFKFEVENKAKKDVHDSNRPHFTLKENTNNILPTPKFTPPFFNSDEPLSKMATAALEREKRVNTEPINLLSDANPYQPPPDKQFDSYVASELHRKINTLDSPLRVHVGNGFDWKNQDSKESPFQTPSSEQVVEETQRRTCSQNISGYSSLQSNPYQQLKREFMTQIALYVDNIPKNPLLDQDKETPKLDLQTPTMIRDQDYSSSPELPNRTLPREEDMTIQSTPDQSKIMEMSRIARECKETEENPAAKEDEHNMSFGSPVVSKYQTPERKNTGPNYVYNTEEAENWRASVNSRHLLESPVKKFQKDERKEFEDGIQVKEFSEISLVEDQPNYSPATTKRSIALPLDQISIIQEDLSATNRSSQFPLFKSNQPSSMRQQDEENDEEELDAESAIVTSRYLVDDRRWREIGLDSADDFELEGLEHFEKNNYKAALEAFNKSLVISQNHFGRDNLRVARLLHKIGYVLSATGKLSLALSCYNESLELTRKHSGDDELSTAELLQNIGNIYFQRGLPKKAKFHYCESLNIKIKKFGVAHPEIAELMINVANVMKIQGRFDEALVTYERGLEILQENGSTEEDLANESVALNNLAVTLMELNRLAEALACFERCLELKKQIHGDSHPEIGNVLTNIGNVLYRMGNFEEALHNYQKSLQVKQLFYSSTHIDVKKTLENIKLAQSRLM